MYNYGGPQNMYQNPGKQKYAQTMVRQNAYGSRDERVRARPYDINLGRNIQPRDKYQRMKANINNPDYSQSSNNDGSISQKISSVLKNTFKSLSSKLNPFAYQQDDPIKTAQPRRHPQLLVDDKYIEFEDSQVDMDFNNEVHTLFGNDLVGPIQNNNDAGTGGNMVKANNHNYFSFVNSPNQSDQRQTQQQQKDEELFEPKVRPMRPLQTEDTNKIKSQVLLKVNSFDRDMFQGSARSNRPSTDLGQPAGSGFNNFYNILKDEEKKRLKQHQSIWSKYNTEFGVGKKSHHHHHHSIIKSKPTHLNAVSIIAQITTKRIAIEQPVASKGAPDMQFVGAKIGEKRKREFDSKSHSKMYETRASQKKLKMNDSGSANSSRHRQCIPLQAIMRNNVNSIGQIKQNIVRVMSGEEMENFKHMASQSKMKDQLHKQDGSKMEEFIENQFRQLQPRMNQHIQDTKKQMESRQRREFTEQQEKFFEMGDLRRAQEMVLMERKKHEEEIKNLQTQFQDQMKEAIRQLAEQAAQTKDLVMQNMQSSQQSNVAMSQQSEEQTQTLIKDMQANFHSQIQSLTDQVKILTESLSRQRIGESQGHTQQQAVNNHTPSLLSLQVRDPSPNNSNNNNLIIRPTLNKINLTQLPQGQTNTDSLQTSNQQSTNSSPTKKDDARIELNINSPKLTGAESKEKQDIKIVDSNRRLSFGMNDSNNQQTQKQRQVSNIKLTKQDSFNIDVKKDSTSKNEEIKKSGITLSPASTFKPIILNLSANNDPKNETNTPIQLATDTTPKPMFSFKALPSTNDAVKNTPTIQSAPLLTQQPPSNTTPVPSSNPILTNPVQNNPFLSSLSSKSGDTKPNPFTSGASKNSFVFQAKASPLTTPSQNNPLLKPPSFPSATGNSQSQSTNPMIAHSMSSNPFSNINTGSASDMQMDVDNTNKQGAGAVTFQSAPIFGKSNTNTFTSNIANNSSSSSSTFNNPFNKNQFNSGFNNNNNNNSNTTVSTNKPGIFPFSSNLNNTNNNANSNFTANNNNTHFQKPVAFSVNFSNNNGGSSMNAPFNAQSNNTNRFASGSNAFSGNNPFGQSNSNPLTNNNNNNSGGSFGNKPFTASFGNNQTTQSQQQFGNNSSNNSTNNPNRSPSLGFSLGVNSRKQQQISSEGEDDLFNPAAGRKIYKARR